MRQLYSEYSGAEFLAQAGEALKRLRIPEFMEQAVPESVLRAVRELAVLTPWGHHLEIMKKVTEPAGRLYYLLATASYGWTRRVLLNQIKAGAYARSRPEGKTHNFPLTLPEHLAEQAAETLKSAYNLEFLGISREIKERELEGHLIDRLKDFMLELGYGFCFIGQQYRLTLGNKESGIGDGARKPQHPESDNNRRAWSFEIERWAAIRLLRVQEITQRCTSISRGLNCAIRSWSGGSSVC